MNPSGTVNNTNFEFSNVSISTAGEAESSFLMSLPSEMIFLIFSKIKEPVSMAKFLQTSRFNYQNLEKPQYWKELCLYESPELFDFYPGLTAFTDDQINWKAVAIDICFNENRVTSNVIARIVLRYEDENDFIKQKQYSHWPSSHTLYVDFKKITENKLKNLVIKEFGFTCALEDLNVDNCLQNYSWKDFKKEKGTLNDCMVVHACKIMQKNSEGLFLQNGIDVQIEKRFEDQFPTLYVPTLFVPNEWINKASDSDEFLDDVDIICRTYANSRCTII